MLVHQSIMQQGKQATKKVAPKEWKRAYLVLFMQ